ncbi:MAG: hypothetical protein JEZ14_05045 [Marinilabiliaceae bacterium]|nr:hypothetical protein [Marinilabiliaceae bacterium]
MRRNTIEKLLGTSMVFLVFMIFAYMVQENMKETEVLFNKYPLLKSDESLNGIVASCDQYKGTTLVDLQDSTHIGIRSWTEEFGDFILNYLDEGDSVVYKPGWERVAVYKRGTDEVLTIPVYFVD